MAREMKKKDDQIWDLKNTLFASRSLVLKILDCFLSTGLIPAALMQKIGSNEEWDALPDVVGRYFDKDSYVEHKIEPYFKTLQLDTARIGLYAPENSSHPDNTQYLEFLNWRRIGQSLQNELDQAEEKKLFLECAAFASSNNNNANKKEPNALKCSVINLISPHTNAKRMKIEDPQQFDIDKLTEDHNKVQEQQRILNDIKKMNEIDADKYKEVESDDCNPEDIRADIAIEEWKQRRTPRPFEE